MDAGPGVSAERVQTDGLRVETLRCRDQDSAPIIEDGCASEVDFGCLRTRHQPDQQAAQVGDLVFSQKGEGALGNHFSEQ